MCGPLYAAFMLGRAPAPRRLDQDSRGIWRHADNASLVREEPARATAHARSCGCRRTSCRKDSRSTAARFNCALACSTPLGRYLRNLRLNDDLRGGWDEASLCTRDCNRAIRRELLGFHERHRSGPLLGFRSHAAPCVASAIWALPSVRSLAAVQPAHAPEFNRRQSSLLPLPPLFCWGKKTGLPLPRKADHRSNRRSLLLNCRPPARVAAAHAVDRHRNALEGKQSGNRERNSDDKAKLRNISRRDRGCGVQVHGRSLKLLGPGPGVISVGH